jgi:hypothetical protein
MSKIIIFSILVIGLAACTTEEIVSDKVVSTNVFGPHFYTYDTIPKIYVYRDVAGGLEEQFHRVFGIKDTQGEHIIVEIYTDQGRIIEALNYNVDSLDIMDHMVVDRNQLKQKAELFKNRLIPEDKKSTAEFASRFAGIMDSTLFLHEISRTYSSTKKIDVMGKQIEAVVFKDEIRLTLFNPFTKMEDEKVGESVVYFAKDFGLVEWHTPNKKGHYKLEKTMTQEEFVNLMSTQ